MTKRPRQTDTHVTRQQMERAFNLYHYLHHTPWYRKLWRRVRRSLGK